LRSCCHHPFSSRFPRRFGCKYSGVGAYFFLHQLFRFVVYFSSSFSSPIAINCYVSKILTIIDSLLILLLFLGKPAFFLVIYFLMIFLFE
jgi:hypothetical protein